MEYFSRTMGDRWSFYAYSTMILLRMHSLRHRSTEYFQGLLREMNKNRLFRHYWHDVYYQERDYFVTNRDLYFYSPQWGSVECYFTSYSALTTAGELHLHTYVPATPETSSVFAQLFSRPDANAIIRLNSPWPEKVLP